MAKKNARKRKQIMMHRDRRKVVICLMLSILAAGFIFAGWRRALFSLTPTALTTATVPTNLSPGNPSKEYIYAGGRLLAVGEPEPASTMPAPTSLEARTISDAQVTINWAAPPGTVSYYQIERSQSINGPFTRLSPDPTMTSFTDSTVIRGMAYLYRVCAVSSEGGLSTYSNTDLATAITFDDDPIILANSPQKRPATPIRATHLTQLRSAIDAVRDLAGLGQAAWKNNPSPQSQGLILAAHYAELRDFLNQALSALGIAIITNDDGIALTKPIMAAHIQNVRDRVK